MPELLTIILKPEIPWLCSACNYWNSVGNFDDQMELYKYGIYYTCGNCGQGHVLKVKDRKE